MNVRMPGALVDPACDLHRETTSATALVPLRSQKVIREFSPLLNANHFNSYRKDKPLIPYAPPIHYVGFPQTTQPSFSEPFIAANFCQKA